LSGPRQTGSKKPLIIGILLGVVALFVVLVIIGALVGDEDPAPTPEPATSSGASGLVEGDCFDADFAPVECSSTDAAWEVFFVSEYEETDSSGDYPGEAELQSYADDQCGTDSDVFALYPGFDTWSEGDREIACFGEI
jgi:hypothetical protein